MLPSIATAHEPDRRGTHGDRRPAGGLSAASMIGGSGPRLWGRHSDCAALDRLVDQLRAGRSPVLVVRGEAGVGKTALLEYLLDEASGCRIIRAAGAEAEMELAYAGLQQLCAPLLDHLDGLPGPQRGALSTAFGLSAGDPADRFFVGLAVLNLCAEAGRDRPLL